MTARRAISGLLCCGVLGGCAALPGLESQDPAPWTQAGAHPSAASVESLLAYFQYIRKVPGAELGKEHEAARQAFLSSRAEFDRVRLAMLLALPGTPVTDEPRALELLDPLARNAGGKFSGLAALLAANLQERKRLDANAQGLQQKLDALLLLERNMIERKRR